MSAVPERLTPLPKRPTNRDRLTPLARRSSALAPVEAPERRRAMPSDRPAATPSIVRRSHGIPSRGPAVATGSRPMVRATAGIEIATPQGLALVPRRRRAARFAVVLCTLIGFVMLGAAAFQTQLAQRQLNMDQMDQQITEAREQYDELRRERAELRSPSRLAEVAATQNMIAASTMEFETVDPSVLALVQENMDMTEDGAVSSGDTPLDDFSEVKAVTGGAP